MAIPSPAYSLISALSAVLTIFHFFHLSYCCLDRPCLYVGYQHLIFPVWPSPRRLCTTPVANGYYYPSTSSFNPRSTATIPLLILLIHRPYRPRFLSPSASAQLVAYFGFVSRRFSFTTDCQPSTLCHDLGSYTPTNHTNNPPRPSHPTTAFVRPAFRTEQCFRALCLCLLRSSALPYHPYAHTSLVFVLLASCES